jgi:diaminopimelate epimerase
MSRGNQGRMLPAGRTFYKMSGSGNDFVMVDAINNPSQDLTAPERVQAICARGTGIGADGLVLLERSWAADFKMLYLNSDGSRADLCGNAALCSVRLAVELGVMPVGECHLETDAGVLSARLLPTGPEVDLKPVADVKPKLPFRLGEGERWIGFALAGVPHLVVRVDDVERVDVMGRGRPLRYDKSLAQGANVNFVSPDGNGGWRIRTYERGVEGETLACGTGAVATAIVLHENGDAGQESALLTRSGRTLRVRLDQRTLSGWHPTLAGEARIVFQGVLGEV